VPTTSPHNGVSRRVPGRGRVWAITAYFDPIGTGRRLAPYREFRSRLHVPLITAELMFQDGFELGPDDADILIKARGGAILWQKERLLNLALKALPQDCEAVAWLDSDVIFQDPEWAARAHRLLDEFSLVQPFSRVYHLGKDDPPKVPSNERSAKGFDSVVFCAAGGRLPDASFGTHGLSQKIGYAPGMAWVARRETLERHGFYDAAIIGTGDKLIFGAACGRYEDAACALQMNPRQRQHYHAWAKPFYETVAGRLTYLDGHILHLWHGDLDKRRYVQRLDGFRRYGFDPDSDLALTPGGAWRWNSDKPELHAHVRKYFESLELEPQSAEPRK